MAREILATAAASESTAFSIAVSAAVTARGASTRDDAAAHWQAAVASMSDAQIIALMRQFLAGSVRFESIVKPQPR